MDYNTNGFIYDQDLIDSVVAALGKNAVFGAAAPHLKGSGRGKTVLLHNNYKAVGMAFPVLNQGNAGTCFIMGQKVLMSDGTEKPIEQIKVGDLVISHKNKIRKVINTFRRQYSGPLIETKVKNFNFSVISTDDHRFYSENGLVQAKNLDGNKVLIPTYSTDENQIRLDLACIDKNFVIVDDNHVQYKRSKKIIKRFIDYDEDLSWIIGLYAAEGGVSQDGSRLTFTLNINEDFYRQEIHRIILNKFGIACFDSYRKNNSVNIRCNSRGICSFFKYNVYGNTWNKEFADICFSLSEANKLKILTGYFDGDGHYSKSCNRIQSISASKKLTKCIQKLCFSVGIRATVRRRNKYKHTKECFELNIYGKDILKFNLKLNKNITNHKERQYFKCQTNTFNTRNTNVYCIEVEEDHSFICNGIAVSNCTSFGCAGGVDVLKVTEIANGERSEFNNITATEPIYRGGRLSNGKIIVRGDGAVVSLAVRYMHEMGTIARGKYGNIDLSTYSIDRSRKWGQNSGFPKSIENISKEHVIEQYTQIKSYDEWIDSIANGHPVIFGSQFGFSNKCNNDGFAANTTKWSHCMYSCAIRHDKPGVLVINSWGNWNVMPVRKFNEPQGSFWITAEICDKIARTGDCWSIAGHQGYNKKVNYNIEKIKDK